MIDGVRRVVWVVFGLVSLFKSFFFFLSFLIHVFLSSPQTSMACISREGFWGGCQSTELIALQVSEKQNLMV